MSDKPEENFFTARAQDSNNDLRKLILLVDDEINITETFSLLLELHEFRVITASSAVEALELFKIHRPDMIISDCMMPLMDGVTFCNIVRSQPEHDQAHFILMSAAPERHQITEARYDVFLKKPFRFDVLLEEAQRLGFVRKGCCG